MIRSIAIFVTLTAAAMAGTAAWDRGGTILDKSLLVSMNIVIVLAVHFLPAITKKPAAWIVWFFCLLSATYGHLTFLVHSHERAGQVRAVESVESANLSHQIEQVEMALAQIKARPAAVVAADLSKEPDRRARAALNIELAESRKAAKLRDEILRLSSLKSDAQISNQTDPVTHKLSQVLGVTEATILVTVGLTFAVLVELFGTLLWMKVMPEKSTVTPVTRPVTFSSNEVVTRHDSESSRAVTDSVTQESNDVTTPMPAPVSHVSQDDLFDSLQTAIADGLCKPTVSGIREHFGCSQARATELRRMLQMHPQST